MEFMLGQRVVYSKEICVVCCAPKGCPPADIWSIWVKRPIGYESCVALTNVKPLPGGQL